MSILERDIETAFVEACMNAGFLPLKIKVLGWIGWPDRLVLGKNRHVFWVELKRFGHEPPRRQTKVHDRLRKLGFNVYVPDTIEECYDIIEKEKMAA